MYSAMFGVADRSGGYDLQQVASGGNGISGEIEETVEISGGFEEYVD